MKGDFIMPIDDIGSITDIPDEGGSTTTPTTGGTTQSRSNIAGYDITDAPIAPSLLINFNNNTQVAVYVPVLTPSGNGYLLSWTNNAGLPNPDPVVIVNGYDGTDGTNGTDGVTFTPQVTPITDGYRISFVNDGGRPNPNPVEIHNGAEGPQGPQGPQGIQGEPGPAGADGEDGFSPVATVTKSGTVITITITDANGTTTQSFDTATGGGVPVDYMDYDWDEETYTAKEVTGIELYDSGSEIDRPPYAKMHVTYRDGEETNDTDIIIGLPIMFTTVTQSGVVSLPITSVYKSGNQFSITLGDDSETIYLNSVPDSGTTGYVLTKTANGYEWQASQGGGGGGITPTVIIGNQAYPATALQYDPSINSFAVQAQNAWYGYVVPNMTLFESAIPGTYQLKNVAINTDNAEAVLTDTENRTFNVPLIPLDGTTGQVLTKSSNGKPVWADVLQLPTGGTAGQMLAKYSSADGAASWVDVSQVPSGGNIGEVLKKYGVQDGAYSWGSISEVPTGGSTGDVLTKTASGYTWQTPQSGGGATFGINSNEVPSHAETVFGEGTGGSATLALTASTNTTGATITISNTNITIPVNFSDYRGALFDLAFRIKIGDAGYLLVPMSNIYRSGSINAAQIYNFSQVLGDMSSKIHLHVYNIETPSNVAWESYTITDAGGTVIGNITAPVSFYCSEKRICFQGSAVTHSASISITPVLARK